MLAKFSLFIIDDDIEIRSLYSKIFEGQEVAVTTFSNAEEALEWLHLNEVPKLSTILCDLKLPKMSGLAFIQEVISRDLNIPVILITAHASVETAVDALKKGAFDYVVKPVHLDELQVIVQRARQFQSLREDHSSLKRQFNEQLSSVLQKQSMIGKSAPIRRVFELVDRVSRSTANVLITGESGTGKEMVARSIHQRSARKDFPFVAINCSAIPDYLLESELFGHKKGAFTGANENRRGLFEEAEGGTVFLDEIGDMPLGLQSKLLRVLQERKVKPVGENVLRKIDVRIIAATHKDIRLLSLDHKFREDLYYRICVIPIQLPALKDRPEDIPLLAQFFLGKYCKMNGTSQKRLSKNALHKLMQLPWNGNVRELENTIERSVVLSDQEVIDEDDIQTESISHENLSQIESLFSEFLTLKEVEKSYIEHVLKQVKNVKEKAALILGINRKTLYRKEIEYGLSSSQARHLSLIMDNQDQQEKDDALKAA